MTQENQLVVISMDDVRAHITTHSNVVKNLISANELQLKHMAMYDPEYNMDNFPEGFPIEDWLKSTLEASTPEDIVPNSPPMQLFCAALTITSITTRLPIPVDYVYLDIFVCEAIREITTAYAALAKTRAELEEQARMSKLVDDGLITKDLAVSSKDLISSAVSAAIRKMPAKEAEAE